MTKISIQRSVRFDSDQYNHLKRLAADQHCSISDVLRDLIERHRLGVASITDSHLRLARLAEYTQAAVDTLIREDHPDHRQIVMDEVNRRMERYHGAR